MDPRARSSLAAALLLLGGCNGNSPADPSLRAAMLAGFCPEAGRVRATLAAFPPSGTVPTPADWRELRRPAIAMLDAAEALPKAVTDLPGYSGKVSSARAAGRSLVEAVDRRDAAGAREAGVRLLQACAGCHAAGGSAPPIDAGAAPTVPATP